MLISLVLGSLVALRLAAAFAPSLEVVYELDLATQGIAFSFSSRKFFMHRYSPTDPPQAVELFDDNSTVLYPNTVELVQLERQQLQSPDHLHRLYYLDDIKASNSGIDDVRFGPSGDVAYISDTAGALLVVNLTSGAGDYTEAVVLTPSTGGTAIDGDGNLYLSDTNLLAIWKGISEGYTSILVQDDALVWTDQMWITADKKLWLPDSQMRPGGSGLMAASPNHIFRYPIDAGPSLIDHA